MPDCAPIETLLTFFCEEANEVSLFIQEIDANNRLRG